MKDKEYTGKVRCVHDSSNKNLNPEQRQLVYTKAMELQELYKDVNKLIEKVNEIQEILTADSVAYRKKKNAIAFHDDLQKLKGELMGIKKTSIFADEKRLREKVSELYSNFCYTEAAPNKTQLESIDDLKKEYGQQREALKKVIDKHLPKNPDVKMDKKIE